MSESGSESMKISQLFDQAWSIQDELEKLDNTHDPDYIRKLRRAIDYLEKLDCMIEEIHLFSDNESIEEISTNELRYFLYPALLAWLLTKINYNFKDRLNNLQKTANFYLKFLKLTKNYELHSFAIPNLTKILENSNENSCVDNQRGEKNLDKDLLKCAYDRNEKIRRFKEQKELENQLELMKATCKNPHIDDEQKRNFYLTCIKFWLNRSIEDIKSIFDEIKLLKARENTAQDQLEKEKDKPKVAPIKPYILTRDTVQAKVLGAGYPSLPVYSIGEFYDQLVDKGCMPHEGGNNLPVQIGGGVTDKQKEDDKIEKDKLEDADDEENLKKQREWDDWKDDNKRGSGNRFNRS